MNSPAVIRLLYRFENCLKAILRSSVNLGPGYCILCWMQSLIIVGDAVYRSWSVRVWEAKFPHQGECRRSTDPSNAGQRLWRSSGSTLVHQGPHGRHWTGLHRWRRLAGVWARRNGEDDWHCDHEWSRKLLTDVFSASGVMWQGRYTGWSIFLLVSFKRFDQM